MESGAQQDEIPVSCDETVSAAGADSGYDHIASVIVHALPEYLATIERQVHVLQNVTVHASDTAGKLILTLETTSESALLARMEAIGRFDGVLGTYLVYHHAEPLGALEEPVCHD